LHFGDNRNEPDRTGENFETLWKIRDLFEILTSTFSKFYNTSENRAVDKVIVSFKEKVIFTSVSASKFSNFVTRLDTRVTQNYTWGRTVSPKHST